MPKQKVKRKKSAKKKLSLGEKIGGQFKHWFLPGKHNQGRPKLIRGTGMLILLLVVVVVQGTYGMVSRGVVLGDGTEITAGQLLDITNAERAKVDKAGLKMNAKLAKAAEMKAQNMLSQQYWSHDAPDGTKPWAWMTEAGYEYSAAGENLAKGFNNSTSVVKAWMASPSHRENVLKESYLEVGFGVASGMLQGKETTLVVAMYGKPAESEVLAGTVTAPDTALNLGGIESKDGIWTKMKRGVQSAAPSLIFILTLLSVAGLVAILAQMYRKHLPKNLQKSWRRHHGLYKLGFVVILAAGAILSYGGGMI